MLLLTACGVRLESPPPEVPEAGPEEQVRQHAAVVATQIYEAAAAALTDPTAVGDDGAPVRTALLAVQQATSAHHQALGGVWEPWPGAGPQATAYPSDGPTTPPPTLPSATPGEVLDLLEDGAAQARETALATTGDLRRLLASVAVSRTFLAADVAQALGTSAAQLPAAPLPEPAPGQVDPDISRAVDSARYALEVVAARTGGAERDTARTRATELLAVADAVAPEADIREAAYDVAEILASEGPTTPERALAGAAELDVVGAFLHLLAADWPDPDAALAAATHAAAQARAWGAALPALPGLT